MTTPTVSVVICVHTEERWSAIVRCLEAVERLTLTPNEIFVSVDHNPGMFQRLTDELSSRFPNVQFLNGTEGPSGIGSARNAGIRAASSEFVAFLDDDAAPEPQWLEGLVAPFVEPDIHVVAGRVLPNWLEAKGAPRWFPPEYLWIVGATWRGFGNMPSDVRNPIGASMAARRTTLNLINGFSPKVVYGNDETDLCLRIVKSIPAARVRYAPDSIINHEVSRARQAPRYYFKRCWIEGVAKGMTTNDHGRGTLLRELDYCVRFLTTGVLGSLATLRLGRVFFLVGGFGTTLVGWIYSRTRQALKSS
jgi:GT2 family glycosyltransferase